MHAPPFLSLVSTKKVTDRRGTGQQESWNSKVLGNSCGLAITQSQSGETLSTQPELRDFRVTYEKSNAVVADRCPFRTPA